MKFLKVVAVLFLLLGGAAAQAQTDVTVYSYNDRAPFIVDKDKKDGLEYRLCEWLTKESGKYRFTLKVVSAGEAKSLVEKNELKGVLLGVNKVWFPEAVRTANLWTLPVLWDSNQVVSSQGSKFEYVGPASLEGKKLAGVKNFAYPAITEAVKAGKITRVDYGSEILALQAVGAGEADVAIVSEWTLLYEQLRGTHADKVSASNKPFLTFERTILVPKALQDVYDNLNKILTDVKKNEGWQKATSL
jgi:polar amino acid transport system substrate-binding protein